MGNPDIANDGTCDNTHCDEITPWDMAAIMLDEKWFCSPSCARTHLEEIDGEPQSVTLHDPQFAVPRTSLPSTVSEESVNIQWTISSQTEADTAISEIESMYPSDFRIALD